MPVQNSQRMGFPLPGATKDDKRLADILAAKNALAAIDEHLHSLNQTKATNITIIDGGSASGGGFVVTADGAGTPPPQGGGDDGWVLGQTSFTFGAESYTPNANFVF